MPRSTPKPKAKPRSASPVTDAWPEVLTLAEAAAYLRVPEAEIVRLVGPQGLPGRLIAWSLAWPWRTGPREANRGEW